MSQYPRTLHTTWPTPPPEAFVPARERIVLLLDENNVAYAEFLFQLQATSNIEDLLAVSGLVSVDGFLHLGALPRAIVNRGRDATSAAQDILHIVLDSLALFAPERAAFVYVPAEYEETTALYTANRRLHDIEGPLGKLESVAFEVAQRERGVDRDDYLYDYHFELLASELSEAQSRITRDALVLLEGAEPTEPLLDFVLDLPTRVEHCDLPTSVLH